MKPTIILGSTSIFRKQLLEKLHLDFTTEAPNVDETPKLNETAKELVSRLAISKAMAISKNHSNALVIGSDQVCVNNGKILGKPGDFDSAFKQLKDSSSKTITFYTGLALVNSETDKIQSKVEEFHVHFKALTDKMINSYLQKEEPFNCAGSFKSEGLGIALFKKLEGRDPNSLIGLPLIALIAMLENEGIDVL